MLHIPHNKKQINITSSEGGLAGYVSYLVSGVSNPVTVAVVGFAREL
jgi:hypothetical protein